MKNVFEVLTFCIIELRKLEEIAKKEANFLKYRQIKITIAKIYEIKDLLSKIR